MLFCFPCGQRALPPHSLHVPFLLPCGQMALPPHSLHRLFSLPCGQMSLPPHSLQSLFSLPCGQIARFQDEASQSLTWDISCENEYRYISLAAKGDSRGASSRACEEEPNTARARKGGVHTEDS